MLKSVSKTLSVALAILMASGSLFIAAPEARAASAGDTFMEGDIKYQVLEDTNNVAIIANIVDYHNSYAGDFTIPETASDGSATYNVTEIGSGAFSNNEVLTGIRIPDSIVCIREYAFQSASKLTEVSIGKGVKTIEGYAFSKCSALQKIEIPDNVITLGSDIFWGCPNLTEVVLGNGVTSIGGGMFLGCTTLKSVKIGSGVKKIEDEAFQHCRALQSVTIPDSVETIGGNAFQDCSELARVKIGSGVTSIGAYAFSGCIKLKSVALSNSVKSVGDEAFGSCDALESAAFGEGISSIPSGMFECCFSLKSITIPDSIKSIGKGAFSGCTNLTSVKMGDGAEAIGENAFADCSRLESIIIGSSVKEIGNRAFWGCTRLAKVVIPDSVLKINDQAFALKTNLNKNSITKIYAKKGTYAQSYAEDNGMPFVATDVAALLKKTAVPTKSAVKINGTAVSFQAYNIDGSNYFKLRDLAYALNGTTKKFSVEWDAANNAIVITSGENYTKAGGELTTSGGGASKTASKSMSTIFIDDKSVSLTAYNIGGSNYFKLRDIAQALNFSVQWNASANTIVIDTTKGYSE